MNKIEEMSFTIDKTKCTYKLYEYEEETVRKIKAPVEIGEITMQMGYKYIDTKVIIKKYALHREFETGEIFREELICETETYATILTIIKDILNEEIQYIEKLQRR